MHFNISESNAVKEETGHRMQRFYWKEAWTYLMPRNLGSLAGNESGEEQEETGYSGPRNKRSSEMSEEIPRRGREKEERYSFAYFRFFMGLNIC